MKIEWHGFSCFEITAKSPEGKVRLVTDPFAKGLGLNLPRKFEAEIVTVSHDADDANNVDAVDGEPFVIDHAGEYEVDSLFVYGIHAPLAGEDDEDEDEDEGEDATLDGMQNMIARIEGEGMQIAHLGALDRELTDDELDRMKSIDILMIPVGGGRVMDADTASDVIGQVEPRVIIPMTYGVEGVKEELDDVQAFCNAMGGCKTEEASSFTVSRSKLPSEDMLLMILTP